ncbi:MAG: acyltransferase [Solobacterium sp.]|nr:acyltransferase [Solobacterium sp.]
MNPFVEKKAIQLRNKIHGSSGQVHLPDHHSAGNTITVNGENSDLRVNENGYMRNCFCDVKGNDNHISIGNHSWLADRCSIRISGNNNILEIGENCSLQNCSVFIAGDNNTIRIDDNVSAVFTSFHMEKENNTVKVGMHTSLHGRDNGTIEFVLEESTTITVKEDCMISNDVSFRSSDSHSIINDKGERINHAKDIVVNDHVWIGMRSLVLKGTVIQKNSIIGAGSICNKVYEKENCMIAGNPAKIIKENVNWSRDRL